MSDEMTRDDLLDLMQAWGWRLTDTVPGAWRLDVWTHPNGMDEALVPVDQRAAGYARHLRQAEVNFAHAEAPRLLAVVREVAAANGRYMRGTISGVSLSVDIHAALGTLTGHGGMLGTEGGEGA